MKQVGTTDLCLAQLPLSDVNALVNGTPAPRNLT